MKIFWNQFMKLLGLSKSNLNCLANKFGIIFKLLLNEISIFCSHLKTSYSEYIYMFSKFQRRFFKNFL